MIDNPAYEGKWRAPQIPNPKYQGIWKPRMIPNPKYFEDKEPYKMTPIVSLFFLFSFGFFVLLVICQRLASLLETCVLEMQPVFNLKTTFNNLFITSQIQPVTRGSAKNF